MGGLIDMPYTPVYATTKAGVIHFTKSIAELASQDGIRVNAICPSFTDTPLVDDSARDMIFKLFGGLVKPELVAEGVVTLCKDDSKSGAVMRITYQRGIDYWDTQKRTSSKL